jgi:hypothetical protein
MNKWLRRATQVDAVIPVSTPLHIGKIVILSNALPATAESTGMSRPTLVVANFGRYQFDSLIKIHPMERLSLRRYCSRTRLLYVSKKTIPLRMEPCTCPVTSLVGVIRGA